MRRPESDLKTTPATYLSEPQHAVWLAALAYVVAALTLAYPALGGGFLLTPHSDQYIAGYPFREFAAASLKAGHGFPEWNPYLLGGMPYIAAMHGDIFYPTFLLRMILPTDVAMTWGFIIHLILAGFFTYGFLRAWGLGFYPALIGGLAYMLSGPIAGFASPGHDGKLFVSALLPLGLWLLVRLIRDGRAWAWGAFALTVGLAFLTPHPQLFQYFLLACGAFTLYLAFSSHDSGLKLPRALAVRRMGYALGAVALGVVIGAIQYMPALLEYEKWSPRGGGEGYEHATSFSMPPAELFNAIVPEFSGVLEGYWGENRIHFHSEYAGVVALVLAGIGLFAGANRRGFRWFWLGTFIVSLIWALGGYTGFYQLVYNFVPYTKYLRAPSTMMFLSMFALSVLAAVGVERVLQSVESLSTKAVLGWAGALAGLCVLMMVGLPKVVAESLAARMSGSWPPEWTTRAVDLARANQGAVVIGSLRAIAFILATLAVLWAMKNGRLARQHAMWALAGLVVVDLWITEHRYWQFSPKANVTYASDPAIEAVRSASEPGRVLTWDTGRIRDAAFYDALMAHDIRLANGYHGNELDRFLKLLDNDRAKSPLGQPFSPEFFRHENVRYLYTTLPDSLMGQLQQLHSWPAPAVKLVGPVRNAAGNQVYLYRLPGDNPPAWVTSAIVKANDDAALAIMFDPRFDPSRAAIMDTAARVQPPALTGAPAPSDVKAKVTRYDPGDIELQLDRPAAAGAGLVVSENFYPGWRATVDGKDAEVARTNYNLIGVVLPAGARNIQLRFQDAQYQTGKTITLVAIALAVAALIAGIAFDRRRPAAALAA